MQYEPRPGQEFRPKAQRETMRLRQSQKDERGLGSTLAGVRWGPWPVGCCWQGRGSDRLQSGFAKTEGDPGVDAHFGWRVETNGVITLMIWAVMLWA